MYGIYLILERPAEPSAILWIIIIGGRSAEHLRFSGLISRATGRAICDSLDAKELIAKVYAKDVKELIIYYYYYY